VRCGLRALSVQVDTIVVTPADLPRLTVSLIAAMLKAFS